MVDVGIIDTFSAAIAAAEAVEDMFPHGAGRFEIPIPRAAAHELVAKLEDFRVEVDERDETVGKRIRDSEVEKVPVVIVYGDKESDESLAVRERGGEQSTKSLDDLRSYLATLRS